MSGILCPSPKFTAVDANGLPLVGGRLYTFVAGTGTFTSTFTDATLATPNANPVILDASGSASVWLDPTKTYALVLKDSNDVQQWSVGNVTVGGFVQLNAGADQTISGGKLEVPNGIDAPIGGVTPYSAIATDVTVTASTSKVRLNSFTGLGQGLSINLQADGVIRDVPARFGGAYVIDSINGGCKARIVSPAGTVKDYAVPLTAGADYTQHVHTGDTVVTALVTRTLVGNTLGPNGGFRLSAYIDITSASATPAKVLVQMNGVTAATINLLASVTGLYRIEFFCANSGLTNAQIFYTLATYFGGSTTPQPLPGVRAATANDTTLDLAVALCVQCGTAPDNIILDAFHMELLNTFTV